MSSFGTINQKDLNADGTLRRRYESSDAPEGKSALKVAGGFLMINAVILFKNVFFSSEAQAKVRDGEGNLNQQDVAPASSAGHSAKFDVLNKDQDDGAQDADGGDVDALDDAAFADTGFARARGAKAPEIDPLSFNPIVGLQTAEVIPFPKQPIAASHNVSGDAFQYSSAPAANAPASSEAAGSSVPSDQSRAPSGGEAGLENEQDYDATADRVYSEFAARRNNSVREVTNRLPLVAGPLMLADIFVNQSKAFAASDLLEGASDPDGDALEITGLSVSSGTLAFSSDGGWIYTPEVYATGPVRVNYQITDGEAIVEQTAEFDVNSLPGTEVHGTADDDALFGSPGADIIYAQGGDDTVVGREDDDIIFGGNGNDYLIGGQGNDEIHAGSGDDVVLAGDGDDTVFAGDGDDFVSGGDGNDLIFGEAGNDEIHGDGGNDRIFGDAGNDKMFGGAGNDVLEAGLGDDELFGGDGNDVLNGGSGNDGIWGDDGADLIVSGDGDDIVEGGLGADIAQLGAGDDAVVATVGDDDDSYNGGSGRDTYDASQTDADLIVDLSMQVATSGDVGTDQIVGFENVVAGAGDDAILGDAGANHFTGGAGNDGMFGGDGDDIAIATMADGDDVFDGGNGQDTYDASGVASSVFIDLNGGLAHGEDIGQDVLSSVENAHGGSGDDVIIASDEVNVLSGGDGNDIFVFLSGNNSGSGGGRKDRIEDFRVGDKIDVRSFDGNNEEDGLQRLTFDYEGSDFDGIGQAIFRYEDREDGGFTLIRFNLEIDDDDHDDPEFEIEIVGLFEFTSDHFLA